MPVHEVLENGVRVGWRWGQHGRLYRSKKKAEKQARAIFASGYNEHRDARVARRELHRAHLPHRWADLEYQRTVRALVRGVQRAILAIVHEQVLPASQTRHDAPNSSVPDRAKLLLNNRLAAKIAKHLRDKVGVAFDVMASKVDRKNRAAMQLVGIPVNDAAAGLHGRMVEARERSVQLITSLQDDWYQDIRGILDGSQGLRHEEIGEQIAKATGIAERHAGFIARDQVAKWNADLTEARHRAVGITRYRWSTSRDERVRPSHRELDGQEFEYDDPPETNDQGDTNNPGEDYGCRCTATPVLDELEGAPEEPAAGDELDDEGAE